MLKYISPFIGVKLCLISFSRAFLVFVFCYKNCVGQSLAMAMSYGIIARICSEYELILETEGCYEYSLTVKPVGFMLRFRKWV